MTTANNLPPLQKKKKRTHVLPLRPSCPPPPPPLGCPPRQCHLSVPNVLPLRCQAEVRVPCVRSDAQASRASCGLLGKGVKREVAGPVPSDPEVQLQSSAFASQAHTHKTHTPTHTHTHVHQQNTHTHTDKFTPREKVAISVDPLQVKWVSPSPRPPKSQGCGERLLQRAGFRGVISRQIVSSCP